jgi:hypothetical protein
MPSITQKEVGKYITAFKISPNKTVPFGIILIDLSSDLGKMSHLISSSCPE